MASDAVVSAGVVVSELVIFVTGWSWVDPAVSLAIAALILASTWGILRDSVNLALDKVPESVNAEKVQAFLAALPGVTEVHDLHIWAFSTTETAMTAHLLRPDAAIDDAFLHHACADMAHHFGIRHATFQIEARDAAHPCQLAPAHVI